jgi:hypothetical protein
MFIQVIEGTTSDPAALHRRLEIWERDLMPGATGYEGSTGGVTEAGDCILIARFESEQAARHNSARPEQSAWWEETARCFDGPVRFHESTDVQVMRAGGSDDAHFVQVMEGHVSDAKRAHEIEQESERALSQARPDLIGTITAYFDDGEFTSVAYFTSEEEARRNEHAEMPPEMATAFSEWESVMKIDRFLDLTEPWLVSARSR